MKTSTQFYVTCFTEVPLPGDGEVAVTRNAHQNAVCSLCLHSHEMRAKTVTRKQSLPSFAANLRVLLLHRSLANQTPGQADRTPISPTHRAGAGLALTFVPVP
jgi:hypothetical protein